MIAGKWEWLPTWIVVSTVFVTILLSPANTRCTENDIAMYSVSRKATAYIDDESTIYLWQGQPVAYLMKDDDGGFHVYGFNGRHLGWFIDGVVMDNRGGAVGGVADAFDSPPPLAPYKGYRQFKPFKDMRESTPTRPIFANRWSKIPLKRFLLQGVISDTGR
jgi:hypothetical protein